jgi:molecular chaperone GrpE (heat shock protein)
MAAASHKQYTAIFAIGAKMLGSFRGVMSQAQSRLNRLSKTATTSFRSMAKWGAGLTAGLLGIAGIAARGLFGRLFEDGTDQLIEANDRAFRLQNTLMGLEQIRKGGMPLAKKQQELIMASNDALAQQGIISADMLDNMSVQLALAKLPPKEIAKTVAGMADMLATAKGIRATEEDATAFGFAMTKALAGGPVKALAKFGLILSDTQKAQLKELKTLRQRHAFFVKILKAQEGSNKAAMNLPGAQAVKYNQELEEMHERLAKDLLPAQDRLNRVLRDMLPRQEELLKRWADFKADAVEKLAEGLKWVGDNSDWLLPIVTKLAAGFVALNVAMYAASLLNPLGLAAFGIAAASVALYELNKNWAELEQRRDAIGETVRALEDLQKAYDEKLLGSIDKAHDAIVKLFNKLEPFRNKVWDIAKALNEGFVKALMKVFDVLNKVMLPIDRLLGFSTIAGPQADLTNLRSHISSPAQAAARRIPKYATGGIISQPTLGILGERGPEAVIPLSRMSKSGTIVNFAPNITINGNAGAAEQNAMDSKLRALSRDFINQFKAAQQQERRLSYESGYA